MAGRNVFLLAPKYLDLYNDIIKGLQAKGYDVRWVEDDQIENNPFKVRYETQSYNEDNVSQYESVVEQFWRNFFEGRNGSTRFDYFLVIDGLMVCPWLFKTMRNNNPGIRIILYLFDRVQGMYQIDRYFKYYDKVLSFDDNDVNQFGLGYLPIYWCPSVNESEIKYDIFGLAAYNHINSKRNDIYRDIKLMSDHSGLREYIRLYNKKAKGNTVIYLIKSFIKKSLGRKYIPLAYYQTGLITTKSESPTDFRNLIMQSRCILDVQPEFQAGFTARFMWALGLGKKIITTNKKVLDYPFINHEQVFILEDNYIERELLDFINKPFIQSKETKKKLEEYRIDNWLDRMVG